MKNFGKILAFVVVLSMLFTLVAFGEDAPATTPATTPAATETPVATAAPATNGSFSDVKDTDSAFEAITVLCGLGVITGYPDGTFGSDKSITRAEFSAVVDRVKALGDSADAAKGATMFTDVAGDHWASGFINLASQQGIVNGMGDGTFAPDANVTFAQAVKMIVVALGYEPEAATKGGWPSGYLAVAAQRGVTKGVASSKESESATRATVVKMLYNALEVPLMEQVGFGTDTSYDTSNNKLLLDALDVVKVEGKVTESGYSDSDTPKLKSNEVNFTVIKEYLVIDGKYDYAKPTDNVYDLNDDDIKVLVGKTNAKDMLQYAAVAYIKNADDTAELAAIAPKQGKNDTLIVKSADIKVTDTETPSTAANWKLEYYTDKDNNKDDYATISKGATYYYNGSTIDNSRPLSPNTNEDVFVLAQKAIKSSGNLEGTITLLNNDDTDEYDVVYINENKDYVVDEIYPKTYKVSDNTTGTKSIVFDLENKDYDFSFEKDGKSAKFEDIKKDDVLSVSGYVDDSTKELKFGKVVITSGMVSGKVAEFNSEDNEVIIGDKTYEYVTGVDTTKLQPGDEGAYYVNANGKIIAVDSQTTVSNSKLAFVTKIAKSSSIDSTVQVRMLKTTGEWVTMGLASKVLLNDGPSVTTSNTIDSNTINWAAAIPLSNSTTSGGGAGATKESSTSDTYLAYKIAAYDVNSDGKINKLDFSVDSSDTSSSFYKKDIAAATYDEGNKKFTSASYYVTDSTVLYNIPVSTDLITLNTSTPAIADDYVGAVEESITVVKGDVLVDQEPYAAVTAYNYNTDNEVAVLVGTDFSGKIKYNEGFMVVDTVSQVLVDGTEVKKVAGFMKGETVDFTIDSDTLFEVAKTTAVPIVPPATDPVSTALATITNVDDLGRGSVVLFTKDAKGNADKVVLLFNAKDATDAVNAKVPMTFTAVKLFSKTTGSDTDKFIFGYAFNTLNSRYRFAINPADTDFAPDGEYSFATGANVVEYDRYYSSGRVRVADASNIDTDNEAGATVKGDFVFARVNDSDKIADAVIIKHSK